METILSHKEGHLAKAIERETSKLPSDLFLWSGLGMLSASFALQICQQKHASLMVGQWAQVVLIMGLYNKMVKQSGHDYKDNRPD